ncbi:hypothetical protein [Hoyosella altamirensis]|uniref:O-antigen/teichoic acid export membrane protein n=1 Tax=Hoyosella altamirensis TaxID=616997 RepID=A0A839RUJ3_9ACTN|nr:hypothetical protein [Hoyosella altamirensis]MBB3039563.1 O-antigen/teichoic acid export membrane protein [Hoyosella altamirensis]
MNVASQRSAVVAGVSVVAAGSMTANAAAYLLHLPASRWLGPAGYSEFASLLAAQLIIAVPALALQMVIAREVVTSRLAGRDRTAQLRRLGYANAVLVATIAVLLVPVTAAVLNTSVAAAAAALLAAPVLVLLATEQGLLQGQQRFGELAVVLAGAGIARVSPAVVALALGGGPAVALAAAALGAAVAAAGANMLVRRATAVESNGPVRDSDTRRLSVMTVLRASHIQLAIVVFTSLDLVIARVVFEDTLAGQYALGAVAAKVAFWLPHAVGIVIFPRMANPALTKSAVRFIVVVLAGLGVAMVVGAAVLAPVVPFLVGEDYRPIVGLLWLFAAQGAVLAILQGVLLSAIARDRTAVSLVAWAGLGIEAILLLTLPLTITSFLIVAICCATATTGVALATVSASLRR